MARTKENYLRCIDVLIGLKKDYPNRTIGQHIATATADYGDVWGITDKEFLFALEKYTTELEYNLESETSIEKIIANSTNEKLFQLEDEEDED